MSYQTPIPTAPTPLLHLHPTIFRTKCPTRHTYRLILACTPHRIWREVDNESGNVRWAKNTHFPHNKAPPSTLRPVELRYEVAVSRDVKAGSGREVLLPVEEGAVEIQMAVRKWVREEMGKEVGKGWKLVGRLQEQEGRVLLNEKGEMAVESVVIERKKRCECGRKGKDGKICSPQVEYGLGKVETKEAVQEKMRKSVGSNGTTAG